MLGFLGRIGKFFSSNIAVAALLAGACFFVYANALANSFVWDDEEQVVNNTVIRDWDNAGMIFTSSTFYSGGAGLSGGFYRPLVTLSYFWNYMYWGLNPFGYHLMQLLFHCANSFLVFYLLAARFAKNNVPFGRIAALATALVFAVHPANVESVAYVGSIGEVVYAFCVLLGLVMFTNSFDGSGSLVKERLFWGSFCLVFLGLFAKESAIIVLPLMLVYLLLFARPDKKLYLKFTVGTALAAGLYLFLRLKVANIRAVPEHFAPISLAPLWQRLLTIPQEVISYLEIIFFPEYLSISRHFLVSMAADPRFWGSIAIMLFVAAAILFYIAKTRSKIFTFFVLWFAITLAPVLNIIPLDMTMAERWLYMPVIGLLAALAVVLSGIMVSAPPPRKTAAVVFCAIVVALGARTIIRNTDWKNGLSLYGHDIALAARISPEGSFDLENNYGVELFRAGRFDEAGEYFERSIALQPKWATPQNNLGAVRERNGDMEGALSQYRLAAEMGYYLAYENVAGMLIELRRFGEAKTFLEASLAKLPDNSKLQYLLALLYSAENVTNESGSKDKAVYLLTEVLRTEPQNKSAAQLLLMLQNDLKIEL